MSILRTIAMFIYLFGYMILHYGILRRAERAAAAAKEALLQKRSIREYRLAEANLARAINRLRVKSRSANN